MTDPVKTGKLTAAQAPNAAQAAAEDPQVALGKKLLDAMGPQLESIRKLGLPNAESVIAAIILAADKLSEKKADPIIQDAAREQITWADNNSWRGQHTLNGLRAVSD